MIRRTAERTQEGWQQQQGLSSEQWEQLATRSGSWLLWCQRNLEDKLNSHYLKRKNQLDQVSYSLLRVKEKHLANELHLRIKEGEASFEEVAEVGLFLARPPMNWFGSTMRCSGSKPAVRGRGRRPSAHRRRCPKRGGSPRTLGPQWRNRRKALKSRC